MKNKTIAGLIAIIAIVVVMMYVGYVGTLQATPASEPILAPGYKWYHDDEFSYKIGYLENWTIVPKEEITVGEGMLGAAFFKDPNTPGTISVMIASEYDMEELKAIGKGVIINGREGYEAIIQPMPPVKMKLVAFAVAERYYVISCTTSAELFDEYVDTFDNAINSFVIEYLAPVTLTPTPEEGVPGFEAVFAIAGLFVVAYLLRRRE